MTQTMNDLALLAIGIGFGLAICLVAVMVYSLYHTATSFSGTTNASLKLAADQLAANKLAIQQMQNNVNFALSRLDSEALRTSSLAIQRSAKSLAAQVDQLQKVVFAQPSQPAIDFGPSGMDSEAEDDARMIAERARWQAAAGQPVGHNPPSYPAMPSNFSLDGLTEDEKRQRVMEYFERRRAAAAGYPYQPNQPTNPSAPPTAGAGAYASLLDEALSRPPAPSPLPPDFSGLENEEGVDLVSKGELE